MNNTWKLFLVAAVVLGAIGSVIAESTVPVTPTTLTHGDSSRFNVSNYPQLNTTAEAGNITWLTIDAETQTMSWQGYWGNITGTIVLEDAAGYTFYNWTSLEPKGEVYATVNDTVNWTNIHCFNYSSDSEINVTSEEGRYNIMDSAADGINETFNVTNPETFWVGDVEITAATCPATYVYQSSAYQANNFINVLLTDNEALVFTSIIENRRYENDTDEVCYNGQACDFQMFVGEDGHNLTASQTTTTYYFWVELLG
ncbi:MAG: hypothetical protein V1725_03720 [archaeon]